GHRRVGRRPAQAAWARAGRHGRRGAGRHRAPAAGPHHHAPGAEKTMSAAATGDNFSQAELDKCGARAQRWWDPEGPQKPLHALNPARLGYVTARAPLAGASVLDVGCGGGLLSEAMAAAGARVTALDLSPELLRVARLRAGRGWAARRGWWWVVAAAC